MLQRLSVIGLVLIAMLSFAGKAVGATNTSLFVYNPEQVKAGEHFDVTVELNGDPGDDLSFFRICIDAGAGAGAQCSEALNHGTVPVFKVNYANPGSYGLSVWMDAYSDGAWRYFGDVAMVQKTIQVTQSDNPQPGTDATLSLSVPNDVVVGKQVTLQVTLNGNLSDDLNKFRLCIDPGNGSGANCGASLDHGKTLSLNITFTGNVPHTASAWVDAFTDGAWHFYPEVPKVEKTIKVGDKVLEPSLYLPMVVTK